MSEEDPTNQTEQLMNALISKMESMDAKLSVLENQMNSPNALLRKAGYVAYNTPLSDGVQTDAFRNDMPDDSAIIKGTASDGTDMSNLQIHEMSWEEIHEMAAQHKEVDYQEVY